MTTLELSCPTKIISSHLEPKIYVACLAAYNNGYLHGRWIDATQDMEIIYQEIRAMLAESPIPCAEEWEIHDYEDFGGLTIKEYEGIDTAHPKALFVQEHGELGAAAAEYYGDIESAKEALENNYHGEWNSELEYASNFFDDVYAHEIPENLRYYIDYESFKRDLFINDCFSLEVGCKVHVFTNH